MKKKEAKKLTLDAIKEMKFVSISELPLRIHWRKGMSTEEKLRSLHENILDLEENIDDAKNMRQVGGRLYLEYLGDLYSKGMSDDLGSFHDPAEKMVNYSELIKALASHEIDLTRDVQDYIRTEEFEKKKAASKNKK